MVVYQALFNESGEILETDSFKEMYHFALQHSRGELHYSRPGDPLVILSRLCVAEYSEDEYINDYGYPQRELLNRQQLGYLAVSRTGYTVEYGNGIYEIERGA